MSENTAPRNSTLNGISEFERALDEVIQSAKHELRVFDTTLSKGFNSSLRTDALRNFLLASRRNRLRIVVHEPGHLDRNCPRLLQLLRGSVGHVISINETHPPAKLIYDPFTIADDQNFVRRFHFDEMRGLLAMGDPIGASSLIDRFEEIWEASSPAVTGTTLGL